MKRWLCASIDQYSDADGSLSIFYHNLKFLHWLDIPSIGSSVNWKVIERLNVFESLPVMAPAFTAGHVVLSFVISGEEHFGLTKFSQVS
ncbi:unnamed protein product [[Candida] boidinii]|nr:unnamed protein product [[Candida] boidinii]